jgi:hypothetical protein
MKVSLICGYQKTGKDALFKLLNSEQNMEDLDFYHFKWRVYINSLNNSKPLNCLCGNVVRRSFADELKKEILEIYQIPIVPDNEKDIKQFKHYITGEIISLRDACIEWGAFRRTQNINYWAEKALSNLLNDNVYIVTDWRFLNEKQYAITNFDVETIRIYRSNVPIPNINIDSEHQLDTQLTDFLLIPDDVSGEFERCLKIFPQYASYVPSNITI